MDNLIAVLILLGVMCGCGFLAYTVEGSKMWWKLVDRWIGEKK